MESRRQRENKVIRHIPKLIVIQCRMSIIGNTINVSITYATSTLVQMPFDFEFLFILRQKEREKKGDFVAIFDVIFSACHVKLVGCKKAFTMYAKIEFKFMWDIMLHLISSIFPISLHNFKCTRTFSGYISFIFFINSCAQIYFVRLFS